MVVVVVVVVGRVCKSNSSKGFFRFFNLTIGILRYKIKICVKYILMVISSQRKG